MFMESIFGTLKPYFEIVKQKILKGEELPFKFSSEISNSLKEFARGNNKENIWGKIMEGLAIIEKIKASIDLYPKNKELALEDLKIGQEIQSAIKKEIGNFVLKGKGNLAKEIQEFNYKLFEEIVSLRVFEERGRIEEVEISFKSEMEKDEKERERKKTMEEDVFMNKNVGRITIKRVEKKEKGIGKKLLIILGVLVLIAGLFSIFSTKKTKAVEYSFKTSEFPEIPLDSVIERGDFDLKITFSEDFWNGLNKKKKMEIVNLISSRAEEKGYLMVNFYFKDGTKIAKWVKGERTYIYR